MLDGRNRNDSGIFCLTLPDTTRSAGGVAFRLIKN